MKDRRDTRTKLSDCKDAGIHLLTRLFWKLSFYRKMELRSCLKRDNTLSQRNLSQTQLPVNKKILQAIN